jgi:hypothetical protein
MIDDEKEFLQKFYCLLRNNLLREKSLKGSSVLISFLETRGNSRFALLSNSTIHSSIIPQEVLVSLSSKKKIQPLGSISDYAITAKGVWEYEKELGVLTEESLLSYINSKFFSESLSLAGTKSNLDEKENVILFSLIAARAFSDKSCVDTKKNEFIKGKWQQILEDSFDLLTNLKVIKTLKKEEFLGKKGNEHVVGYVFRHNNDMIQKTNGIYAYSRKQEYYLNLFRDGRISPDELNFLFWKIFKGELSTESIDTVLEFCNSISRESIYLYDMNDHIFAQPTFDSMLKDSLLASLVSKTKWSNFG